VASDLRIMDVKEIIVNFSIKRGLSQAKMSFVYFRKIYPKFVGMWGRPVRG
jgi:hypothetical protein